MRRFVDKFDYLSTQHIFNRGEYENSNRIFVKSTGKHLKRKDAHGSSVTKHLLEAADFTSKRSIKLNKWFSFCIKKEEQGIDINLVSRKFHIAKNYFVTGIYEVIFEVFPQKEKMDFKTLKNLISELLDIDTRIPKVYNVSIFGDKDKLKSDKISGKEYLTRLGGAEKALARHYAYATSPKKYSSDLRDSLRYIKCSVPSIFIKTDNYDNFILPASYSQKDDFVVQYFGITDNNGLYFDAVLFHNNGTRFSNVGVIDPSYIYKLIMEVPSFEKSLYIVLSNIRENGLLCPSDKEASDMLQEYLVDTLKKIKNKNQLSGSPSEHTKFFESESRMNNLKNVLANRINVRPNTFTKVVAYLEREREKPSGTIKIKGNTGTVILGDGNTTVSGDGNTTTTSGGRVAAN